MFWINEVGNKGVSGKENKVVTNYAQNFFSQTLLKFTTNLLESKKRKEKKINRSHLKKKNYKLVEGIASF